MKQAIVLSIGYDHFVIPAKPAVAGKLLELLSEAVPARKDFSVGCGCDTYRIQPRRASLSVQIVGIDQILPPKSDDFEGRDVVELKSLPGAVRLLNL
jgi:hypothetical protein